MPWRTRALWRLRSLAVALPPYVWLLAFFLAPFLIVLRISFSEAVIAQPPYAPAFDLADGIPGLWAKVQEFTTYNYAFLAEDSLYWRAYLSSVRIAAVSTAVTLVIGFPMAYAMSRAPRRWRPLLLALVILPFWTSFLIRVYAWIGILKRDGLLNHFLLSTGVIGEPLTIMNTDLAVYIGIVYAYLPFMILPLYASLERQDPALLEAASDLGSPPWLAFWQVTVRLAVPGIMAGCLLVFIPAVGEFVIPNLLGGSDTLMIGQTLWDEFFYNRDWPLASAVAVLLVLVLVVPITIFQRAQARTTG
ncbi:ABC transporter permease [Acuticoccus sp. I52.16.1]|uniref:ABC transporter permease n=1 Tax=Acuticoccus sp. I52.16.1 TaxID=2928472 RepID=UPI001FD5C67C|nr:ABC transporter permease subunit [Acuticoccus sp. I52.16.1]UOM36962.1 ABC transporter permease subunit [Acuticoccus sp. I52.16.1]